MENKFAELTAFIPKLKDGDFGKWIIDRENDGTPEHPKQFPFVKYSSTVDAFLHTLYAFCSAHPEFEHTKYRETLDTILHDWDINTMEKADVSTLDAKGVIALLICAVRADRFCDGALLTFLENSSILRWLERLAEIDART